jgi:hypothetical protein
MLRRRKDLKKLHVFISDNDDRCGTDKDNGAGDDIIFNSEGLCSLRRAATVRYGIYRSKILYVRVLI